MNKKLLKLISISGALFLPMVAFAVEVPAMITNIKDALVTIGSSIVIIGWIITGILYLTAAGSPEKTGTAKKSLMACVIGTVLIILAVGIEATLKTLLKA